MGWLSTGIYETRRVQGSMQEGENSRQAQSMPCDSGWQVTGWVRYPVEAQ